MTKSTNSRSQNKTASLVALAMLVSAPLVASLTAPVAFAQNAPRAKKLANGLKCMCGGCEDSAGQCSHPGGSFSGPCETARGMQKDLDDRVAKNESDDAILAAYVTQYGPTVLVEPPKKGFDLLAWIMPVLVAHSGVDSGLVRGSELAQESAARTRRRSAHRRRISGAGPTRSEGRP